MPGDMKNRLAQAPAQRSWSGLLWLFAGLSIGLFIAFLTYLQKQPAADVSFKQAIDQEINKTKKLAETKKQRQASSDDKTIPKFDFYTILKDYEVFVPESDIKPSSKDNKTNTNTDTSTEKTGTTYFLQVGSFQRLGDADKRRATLALLGISSNIQEAQINDDTWYRVKVGPIAGKRGLNKVRDQLIDNNIPTLIMVMK